MVVWPCSLSALFKNEDDRAGLPAGLGGER
jgi:hypothetical protein